MLVEQREHLAVCRLPPDAPWPDTPVGTSLYSVTRTADELSVVCPVEHAPAGSRVESGWRAFRVVGPFEFDVVGVIASITGPLAEAGVAVFVLSTFDTDHLLVKAEDLDRTVDSLEAAGHTVR